MTTEEVQMVIDSEEFADRDRVWCAAAVIAEEDLEAAVYPKEIAERLGWGLDRVEVALEAATEAGIMGTPKTRQEFGRSGLTSHTVHRRGA